MLSLMRCGCGHADSNHEKGIAATVGHDKGISANSSFRGKLRPARMLLPGILLILIPKCPLCLAAWIALGTGIGISLHVATWLRWGLIAICIVSLCYLIFKSTVQLWKNSCSSSGKT
jgi:hypothetical protein